MPSETIHRIEIDTKEQGSEAQVLEKKLAALGHQVKARISKAYTLRQDFTAEQLEKVAAALHNPVAETARINEPSTLAFDWALELGFLPGVTDNVANTATEIIDDLLSMRLGRNRVFSSKVLFLTGALSREEVENMARELINILIERYHIKSNTEYKQEEGLDKVAPLVKLTKEPEAIEIDLDVPEAELLALGKQGIKDPETGERRGPLALDLDYLTAIKAYFAKEGRKPTDIELESIAQTWSEHCKHTIFAATMDDIDEGIMKRYIKGATNAVREQLGENDFCLSVFKDNSGGIIFDDTWMITDKAETHNSPSALDPFGGAITGIVGVNRDTIGFGMGALPIANKYGYCFGRPEDTSTIYRGKNKTNPSLPPKRILDGVIYGVNVGGNCSGIPTPTGFCFFDDHYKGKPLVFVGTLGLLPRKLPNGELAHEKEAQAGDRIVVIGGRVGKDGIHGATFSSEAMDEGSPATAVQIGDPITQKKLSDAVCKEARDLGLYNSVTDNGAGGLSCSVAEMAEECGGFVVQLEKVPLKYPGLQPWETWISESQERMTLSVPEDKLAAFEELMEQRGVECTVIGTFNNAKRGVVTLNGKTIFDLDMDFLHHGLPDKALTSKPYPYKTQEPRIGVQDPEELFLRILGSHNCCSFEFISRQYDHEVQGNSVVKPLQGKGRVNGTASVIKPLFDSKKGVVMSQALNPRMSEVSCYDMAANAIDSAIRYAIAVGADIKHLALMDNFCWCSSNEPERLAQLKDAARACYDYATVYRTPFISGKDSMFNDFKGYAENGEPIKISVHPTLMVSAVSVIDDVKNTCTMDFKAPGDLIYVIGETRDECGASEFYNVLGKEGGTPPKVDAKTARKLYSTMHALHTTHLLSACAAIGAGGLGVMLAKMSIAGQHGAEIDINLVPATVDEPVRILHSETPSRFIVSVDPKKKAAFEKAMHGFAFAHVGEVRDDAKFVISKGKEAIIDTSVDLLDTVYKERFKEY